MNINANHIRGLAELLEELERTMEPDEYFNLILDFYQYDNRTIEVWTKGKFGELKRLGSVSQYGTMFIG